MSVIVLKALILEDRPTDAELMVHELRKAGFMPRWERVDSAAGFREKLENNWDIILSDYMMPDFRAPEALGILQESGLDIPFIVVTGSINEEVAVGILKQGAADYLLKDRLMRLGEAVRHALEEKQMRMMRLKAEEALNESELRFRTTSEAAADAIICVEDPGIVYIWNRKAEETFGYSSSEVIGRPLADFVIPERYREKFEAAATEFFRTGAGPYVGKTAELAAVRKDGAEFAIEASISAMNIRGKWHSIGIIREITERKKAEEEHIKAQKIESLSVLAGGIAHDFNNLLTTIMGNIELAGEETDIKKLNERLSDAEKAVMRAKTLAQQLLVFSKGGTLERKAVSLKDIIDESAYMGLPPEIKCETIIPEGLWPIEAEQGAMAQAINNLVLNAIQAMPGGGRMGIECENVVLREDGEVFSLKKGRYVKLTVSDTGNGIPKEHLPRIFDPYFTTKEHGSGLGLATVYAVIKSHDGHVTVESWPGEGTAFSIYLPASEKQLEKKPVYAGRPAAQSAQLRRKILVMDGEEEIRNLLSNILSGLGYRASAAGSGKEALSLYKEAMEAGAAFDAVILGIKINNGQEAVRLMRELKRLDPDVRALASCGYSDYSAMSGVIESGFIEFIPKPFRISDLSRAMQRVLRPAA